MKHPAWKCAYAKKAGALRKRLSDKALADRLGVSVKTVGEWIYRGRKAPADLTERQQDVLDYIERYIVDEGMPPTRKEISEAFEFKSPNAAHCHLRALQSRNYIKLIPGKSRGIQVCA